MAGMASRQEQLFEDSIHRYRVDHPPLWKGVATQLRLLILSGEIAAETHLVETELAEMLGVSRGPIRQALAQLEQEGFVDIVPRQGAHVLEITPDLVHEKYELRRLLEEYAVRQAVPRLTSVDLARLARHCDEMARSVRAQDLEGFYTSQYRFHRDVVAASDMSCLLRLWDLLSMGIGSLMLLNLYYATPEPYSRLVWQSSTALSSPPGHRELLQVLRQGDTEAAVQTMREHLDVGERSVQQALTTARRYWRRHDEAALAQPPS